MRQEVRYNVRQQVKNWEEEIRKNYTVSHPRRLSSEISLL